jgi:outer membrane protein OmpA-like peptidoglycan-associated protein
VKPITAIIITTAVLIGQLAAQADGPSDIKSSAVILEKLDPPKTRSFKKTKPKTRSFRVSKEVADRLQSKAFKGRGIAVKPIVAAAADSGSTASPVAEVQAQVDDQADITFDNILFKLNSTEFADERSRWQVAEIGKAMAQLSKASFLVEGHTCDLGAESYNHRLSERRATAILSYLKRHGVRDDQLVQAPFGEAEPVAPNTNEANRSKNRRVVIRRMASSPS